MNGAIDTTAAGQAGVGGVDNGFDILGGNVALHEFQFSFSNEHGRIAGCTLSDNAASSFGSDVLDNIRKVALLLERCSLPGRPVAAF